MRHFSLILLMCFSLGLQAINIPHGASSAQHYTNTAASQVSSFQDNLASDYETLQNLMNNMEVAMCGINADNGGLTINTTGSGANATSSYANCTGGAMGYYSSWSNQINYWAGVISTATKNSAWTSGYDACITTYAAPSGYNTNVFNDLSSETVVGYVTNMSDSINQIVGCTHNANPTTPYSATNPDPCPNDLPNNLLAVANTDSTKGPIGLIQNMITTMDNMSNAINLPGLQTQAQTINNTWEQYNTAVKTYTDCFNNNRSSWSNLQVCTTDFENYLNAYETEVNAIIALFDALLPLLPTVSGTYSLEAEPASIVCALAPERCVVPDTACNTCVNDGTCNNSPCQYSVANFSNFDINGSLQQVTNYVQSANNTVKTYTSNVNVMQNRLSALMNQLQTLNTNISNVQNTIQQINSNCKTDVAEYEASQQPGIGFQIVDFIVGNIITMPFIEFLGGLGGPGLELLANILLMMPAINNASFGPITTIISQGITGGN